MAHLYKALEPKATYADRQFRGTADEYSMALANSTTIYVGNLSFFTTEEQIWELFSKTGDVRRIIMGLHRERMTPCGFAFVEYFARKDAEDCVKWINGTKLDDRVIRTDFDLGFVEGRQYGRGKHGGQIRDELRDDYDPGRGGYGVRKANQITEMEEHHVRVTTPNKHAANSEPRKAASPPAAVPEKKETLKRKRDDEEPVSRKAKKPRKEKKKSEEESRSRSRSRSKSRSSSASRSRSRSRSKSKSRSKSRSRSRSSSKSD